jgi:O-Antigen ligase
MTALARSLSGAGRGILLLALLVSIAFGLLAAAAPRLALLALAALVAVTMVARSVLAGVALFVVLTFPEQLPGALGVGSTLAKPLGLLLIASWLLVIVGDRERQVPFLPRDAPTVTVALVGLLVWALASAIWAEDSGTTISTAARLAQLVALVFITYSAVRRPRDLLVLVVAVVVGAVITSGYALANGTLRAGRLTGGLFNPNNLAANLVVAAILAMFLFALVRRASLRVALLMCSAVFGAAFVQTQSRSGLIAVAVAASVAIAVAGPLRARVGAVVLVVAAIALSYYVVAAPPQLKQRVASIAAGGQASPLREDTWQIALRMSRDHPLNGVGLGNFPLAEAGYLAGTLNVQEVASLRRYELVAHNTYLEFLAELGLVGLALFVMVVATTLGGALATVLSDQSPQRRVLAGAMVAATMALLASQIFNSGQYSKQFWLLLGMTLAASVPRRPKSLAAQRRLPRTTIAAFE